MTPEQELAERISFEHKVVTSSFKRLPNGEYEALNVQLLWEGWVMRAEIPPLPKMEQHETPIDC
jgi:hypothetical protein